MKAILLFNFLILLCTCTFGQFKHVQNSSGDPLTEIVDPNGMKQGNWIYVDSDGSNFRTEIYKNNNLMSNIYNTKQKAVDISSYTQKNIAGFTQKPLKNLAIRLAQAGNGEIIVLDDNTISVHFYYDKVKAKATITQVHLDELEKLSLQKTIIFF